jgi:uncharacterized protein YjbJ (UPF0337 family)
MGVVHRDLKPENIMIGKPGEDGQIVTKLLDLGIAKMKEIAGGEASGTTALTIAGQVLGTPFYMSPEQWGEVPDDGSVEIDGRADIYSLGVVFYELIAGRRPFVGLTLQELRREHVNVTPRPLNEVVSDVPEAFGQAIQRAMAKDRGKRQATAGELATELRAALGLPALAGSSPSLNFTGSTHNAGPASETNVGTSPDSGGRNTSAELITPTIVTVDSPPRPQNESPQHRLAPTSLAQPMPPEITERQAQQQSQASPPPQQQTPQFPTIATSPSASGYGAQASPSLAYAPASDAAAPSRSSKTPLIIAAAAVLLIGGGVGGWFLLSKKDGAGTTSNVNSSNTGAGNNSNSANTNGGGTNGTITNTEESLTYWLEVAEAGPGGGSARVAPVVAFKSGQSFKFHFTPRQNGFLYIIGPGEDGKPLTFLTAVPVEDSGLESNEVEGGEEFAFPEDEDNAEHWVTLDKKAGTETYTIIFSPTQLTAPAFLNEEAGRELTEEEQKELDDFRAKYKANAPTTDVINGGGTDPLVSVKAPQAAKGEVIVFDVRIEHK